MNHSVSPLGRTNLLYSSVPITVVHWPQTQLLAGRKFLNTTQLVPCSIYFHSPAWMNSSFTECQLSLSVLNKKFIGEDSVTVWTPNTEQYCTLLSSDARQDCCPTFIWSYEHLASSAHPLKQQGQLLQFVLNSWVLSKFIKYLHTGDLPVGSCDKLHALGKSQLQLKWVFSHRRAADQRTALELLPLVL